LDVIRLLTQEDREPVQSYLEKDLLHNIYLIHGLQTYGLASEHGTFWGAFSRGQLEGVLFADNDYEKRFGSLAGDNAKVLVDLGRFALKAGIRTFAGKRAYIQAAIQRLPSRYRMIGIEHLDFLQVHPGQLVGHYDYPVRVAGTDDIPLLVELYKHYELGGEKSPKEVEHEIRRAMAKGGVYFVLEIEGRVVSGARIFPQTDRAGIVDGATTLPEFRGRGLYPCVYTACSEYLFQRGRVRLGLINEANTNMHKVMRRCGGSFTDKWLIAIFVRKPPLRRRILPVRFRRWALSIRDRITVSSPGPCSDS
jgi:predicted GNAT family acetyltransferase